MKLHQLTIRQLTVLASIALTVLFAAFYLSFRYFWTYDQAVLAAKLEQEDEVSRVKTIINLRNSELARLLSDYAAWDEVVEFLDTEDPAFIEASVNDHTFESNYLSGIFIFDTNLSLTWGRAFDLSTHRDKSFDEIRYRFGSLMADTLRSPTDKLMPYVRFLIFDGQPMLMATSRICDSYGVSCDKGFMMFMKPIGDGFTRVVRQATGIEVRVLASDEEAAIRPNITILNKLDYQNRSNVRVLINHNTQLPDFISASEMYALGGFSLFMFAFNLMLVHYMVKPVNKAMKTLNNLQQGKPIIADEHTFISYEMRGFASRINEVFSELESKRAELEWNAFHDALTQVANRRRLQIECERLLTERSRANVAMLLLDVDFFKPYNDHYGHLQGDVALQQVAKAIDEGVTASDKLVARFGGEEFCVLLSSNWPIDLQEEANSILDFVSQLAIPHAYSDVAEHITVSIGGFDCNGLEYKDLQQAFLAADSALYQAKEQGRNRAFIYKDIANKQKEAKQKAELLSQA